MASLVVLDTAVPAPPSDSDPSAREVLSRVSQIRFRAQLRGSLPAVAEQIPVVCLPAPAPRSLTPLQFGASVDLIHDAYESSAAFLADLQVLGPGLYGDPFSRYTSSRAHESPADLSSAFGA